MRGRFEFALYPIPLAEAARGSVDASLQLMASQGWRIAGLAPAAETLVVALEREIDEPAALPDPEVLAATLEEPLVPPPL